MSQKDLSLQVGYFQDFGTGETAADEDGRQEQVILKYYYDIECFRLHILSPDENLFILLMDEILHHLVCIKPCKQWDKLPINWCRILSINSMYSTYLHLRYDFSFGPREPCSYGIQYLDATSDEWLLCGSGWADTKNIVFLCVYIHIIYRYMVVFCVINQCLSLWSIHWKVFFIRSFSLDLFQAGWTKVASGWSCEKCLEPVGTREKRRLYHDQIQHQ